VSDFAESILPSSPDLSSAKLCREKEREHENLDAAHTEANRNLQQVETTLTNMKAQLKLKKEELQGLFYSPLRAIEIDPVIPGQPWKRRSSKESRKSSTDPTVPSKRHARWRATRLISVESESSAPLWPCRYSLRVVVQRFGCHPRCQPDLRDSLADRQDQENVYGLQSPSQHSRDGRVRKLRKCV